MLKSQAVLEVKNDERIYQFSCAADAPLGEVYDTLNQMRTFIVEKIKSAQEQQPTPVDSPAVDAPVEV